MTQSSFFFVRRSKSGHTGHPDSILDNPVQLGVGIFLLYFSLAKFWRRWIQPFAEFRGRPGAPWHNAHESS